MFGTQQRALRAGLAAAAMIGLAVTPTAVMAHSAPPVSVDAASVAHLPPRSDRPDRADHLDALAQALDIAPEALKAAMQTAHEASQKQLATTLAAILKLDVAKVRAALDANKPEPRAQRGEQGGRDGSQALRKHGLDSAAEALGVTTEALRAAMQAGREATGKPDPATMQDRAAREAFELKVFTMVAGNLGVDVTKLRAALQAGRPDPALRKNEHRAHLVERLAGAVEDGTITRAEAAAMLERFDAAGADRPGLRDGGPAIERRPGGPEKPQGQGNDQRRKGPDGQVNGRKPALGLPALRQNAPQQNAG